MKHHRRTFGTYITTQLGCLLLVLIFNLCVGGWSVDYILKFLGRDVPFIVDALIGLFVAQLSVPIAVVLWIFQ